MGSREEFTIPRERRASYGRRARRRRRNRFATLPSIHPQYHSTKLAQSEYIYRQITEHPERRARFQEMRDYFTHLLESGLFAGPPNRVRRRAWIWRMWASSNPVLQEYAVLHLFWLSWHQHTENVAWNREVDIELDHQLALNAQIKN